MNNYNLLGRLKQSFIITLCLTVFACGGGSVELGGSSVDLDNSGGSTSTNCEDSGDSLTTGNITALQAGTICNTPTPSSAQSGTLILDCSQPENRTTTATTTDITTVSCGSGSGQASTNYYCENGIVIQDDGGSGTELFDQTQVTCTIDDDENATLSADELIVSQITDFQEYL